MTSRGMMLLQNEDIELSPEWTSGVAFTVYEIPEFSSRVRTYHLWVRSELHALEQVSGADPEGVLQIEIVIALLSSGLALALTQLTDSFPPQSWVGVKSTWLTS